ncbi:hypothetical protein HNQ51_001723 [Inhella inkyongensis]|uniref:Peptidase n=1 Tax=Inhella inkyongensis TaxID=392593 RepID=A0A840S7I3_9BURK|nr:peptidase [Inhella inkyongensis]MBB5204409.1 hypothetical protein [Inhella inkyongensis]
MASMPQRLHIFKPGEFTAMSGERHAFTPAMLRGIAASYSPAVHEAPIVVGHPKADLPAYGWVQGLEYQESDDASGPAGLYAQVAQVNADFADMVAAGAFKKISAAFYGAQAPGNPCPGSLYLRHVGFLGAQPPAVKGLRNPAFSDAEDGVLCFSEPTDPSSPTQESAVTEEEAAQLRAENERLAAQNAALAAQAAEAAAAGRHAENLAFAEKLVADGRLLSAALPVIVATLDHLAAAETPIEFGEGEAKAPLLKGLKEQLQASPVLAPLGQTATTGRAAANGDPAPGEDLAFAEGANPARLEQHKQILAHAAKHQLSYADAAAAVLK